ncbi:LuxR C-terminal-related transcriptional regulator [Escherichia coli]|uniref:LuxR C-terminal-related transcriptional regulator n=2 Tax=Escherichia coli TaxID=562 RepID=UPI001121D4C4|nr:LuxR C-terminal-related transcriptional regulator [Escherichia coli]EIY1065373.1 helix-turn-helix transcriptional regulator [Escherichia coli]KAB3436788.1 helix-turn-helix transcriptional regulator [Escherichia coli]TPD00074.1 helix-turn-helix transcriptional regulator [Escherichia coli]
MMLKILLLDDDNFFRQGLKICLREYYKKLGVGFKIYNNLMQSSNYNLAFIDEKHFSEYLNINTGINSDILFVLHDYNHPIIVHNERIFFMCRRISVSDFTYILSGETLSDKVSYKKKLKSILSKREIKVLKYYSLGYNDLQIGFLLGINIKTVSTHKINAMMKLNFTHKGAFRCWLIKNAWVFTYF